MHPTIFSRGKSMEYNINVNTWFIDRRMSFLPPHFVDCGIKTYMRFTFDKLREIDTYISEVLVGRYYFGQNVMAAPGPSTWSWFFEDPEEAMIMKLMFG